MPQPLTLAKGGRGRYSGVMFYLHNQDESIPAKPKITSTKQATVTWVGESTTTTYSKDYFETRFPFVVEIAVDDAEGVVLLPFRATWETTGRSVSWSMHLVATPRLAVTPKALLWKSNDYGPRQFCIESSSEAIEVVAAEASKELLIRKTNRSPDGRSVIVEVECLRKVRGNAGGVVITTNLQKVTVPVFRLGGEA